ncbi:hypothetical protein BaRGS_00004980, partial [Batillaria attramentaria]
VQMEETIVSVRTGRLGKDKRARQIDALAFGVGLRKGRARLGLSFPSTGLGAGWIRGPKPWPVLPPTTGELETAELIDAAEGDTNAVTGPHQATKRLGARMQIFHLPRCLR